MADLLDVPILASLNLAHEPRTRVGGINSTRTLACLSNRAWAINRVHRGSDRGAACRKPVRYRNRTGQFGTKARRRGLTRPKTHSRFQPE